MALSLRVVLLIVSLMFLFAVFRLVYKGRLLLKYSLLWMVLSVVLLLCAAFPEAVGAVGNFFGIVTPSNFIFLLGFVCLLAICVALTVIVSWQARDVRYLIQEIALLHKDLADEADELKMDENGHVVRE